MLESLSRLITGKPWLIVSIILMITIGFSTLLPLLEMNTSMEDFLPDDEVVLAEERIQSYFGASTEVVMVHAEGSTKTSLFSARGLSTLYDLSRDLAEIPLVDDVMSLAGFVDMVCGLEYNKSLDECSSEEITSAYFDLIKKPDETIRRMHEVDDGNEDVDFQRFHRFSSSRRERMAQRGQMPLEARPHS